MPRTSEHPLLPNDTSKREGNNKTTRKRIDDGAEEKKKGNGSLLKRRGVNGLAKALKDYLKNLIKGDSGRKLSELKGLRTSATQVVSPFL